MNKTDVKNMIKEELTSIVKEAREFVIIDPRGNERPVGAKSQGNQFLKKMGGARKGWFMVQKKNALKARRAIEKAGGSFSNSKLQDTMFDLMYEGKLKEAKLSNSQWEALENMNDWLPKGKEEEYLEIMNQGRLPAMLKFLKKYAKMKVLKKYSVKSSDLKTLAGALMNEAKLTEGLSSSDIKKATKAIQKYVKKLGRRANGEAEKIAQNIADILSWDLRKQDQLTKHLIKINNGDDEIIFEGKLNEGKYDNKVSEKFKSFLDNLPEKKMTPKNVQGYAKASGGLTAKYGLAYAMDAFGWMKYMKEGKLTEGFATWEMSFAPMTLSGVKLDPKKKYKVKARSTVEAIKKASKMAGLSGNDWMATQTHKLIKIGG